MKIMRTDGIKSTLLFVPLIALALLAGGCGNAGNSGTETTASPSVEPSTAPAASAAATASPAADLSGVTLRIGQVGWSEWEEGFRAAGLLDTPYKVEFSVFQGGNLELEAIAANQLDFAITSEIPPIFASQAANQGNFNVIGVQRWNTLNQELVVPKDSKVKSVAELKGKKVAYVQNTTAQYFLVKMLEGAGLTWKDIEPVKLTTAEGLSALVGGKVDALASYGNSIIAAHQNGATTLASAKDILSGNFPISVNTQSIEDPAKHAALADFLERLTKYYTWTQNNQEPWAEITAKNTNQKQNEVLETLVNGDKQRPLALETISEQAITSQQDIANTLTDLGLLPGKIDVSAVWSHAFDDDINAILANK